MYKNALWKECKNLVCVENRFQRERYKRAYEAAGDGISNGREPYTQMYIPT